MKADAKPSSLRNRTRRRAPGRAVRLAVAASALAVLASACVFDPGPRRTSGATPSVPATGSAEGAIREVFAPLGVAEQAVAVAVCESGLDPGAVSSGGTYRGLFQLGPHLVGTVDFYGGNWFDPLTNAQVARDLYLQSGWASWPVCGRV